MLSLRPEIVSAQRENAMEEELESVPIQVSAEGERLDRMLDEFDVEHHWLASEYVNWETGDPQQQPESIKKSHCSSFVAVVAKKLGIYILRPPQHPEENLANAQNGWLEKYGREYGWEPVAKALKAQELANEGYLVVASYENPNRHKPGHIAVVRPFTKSEAQIEEEGPQIIQAGEYNYNSTSVKVGFKEFSGKEVLYFFNDAVGQERRYLRCHPGTS